jgi:hypothetical protein
MSRETLSRVFGKYRTVFLFHNPMAADQITTRLTVYSFRPLGGAFRSVALYRVSDMELCYVSMTRIVTVWDVSRYFALLCEVAVKHEHTLVIERAL